jgi:hypothetical protein
MWQMGTNVGCVKWHLLANCVSECYLLQVFNFPWFTWVLGTCTSSDSCASVRFFVRLYGLHIELFNINLLMKFERDLNKNFERKRGYNLI